MRIPINLLIKKLNRKKHLNSVRHRSRKARLKDRINRVPQRTREVQEMSEV